jgi:hypothetical protein
MAGGVLWRSAAQVDVMVHIDRASQRVSVRVDDATRYNWAISTGRDGLRHAERHLPSACDDALLHHHFERRR